MRLVLVIPPAARHATEQRIALRDEPIDIGGAADCDVSDRFNTGAHDQLAAVLPPSTGDETRPVNIQHLYVACPPFAD